MSNYLSEPKSCQTDRTGVQASHKTSSYRQNKHFCTHRDENFTKQQSRSTRVLKEMLIPLCPTTALADITNETRPKQAKRKDHPYVGNYPRQS
jgi:hypothetical protein